MISILKDDFETRLGIIQTCLESDFIEAIIRKGNYIQTRGYNIYLQPFEVNNQWFNNKAMTIESSRGWRWYIEKSSEIIENLNLYCRLINPSEGISFGSDTGQYLDAIEIENAADVVHIGTEDGELMQARAEISDWMPERFKNELSHIYSFTEFIDYGFKTIVPHLNVREKIYFHFLVATNGIKQSVDYPNERDVSTWFAVDQHKRFLDKSLGNHYNN